MELQEINEKLEEYYTNNIGCWIGVHDSHREETSPKIELNGLMVSHSPYGKKARRFMDENGNINLDNNFKATMYHLSTLEAPTFEVLPQSPVLVNIPKEILEAFDKPANIEDSYKDFCVFGYQEPPTQSTDEYGFPTTTHGDITPKTSSKGANVRIIPSFFVAGHFNMALGDFVENPKHFSHKTPDEQKRIIEFYKEFIQTHSSTNASENII